MSDWNGRGRGAYGGVYETYYLVFNNTIDPNIIKSCSIYYNILISPDLKNNTYILANPKNNYTLDTLKNKLDSLHLDYTIYNREDFYKNKEY